MMKNDLSKTATKRKIVRRTGRARFVPICQYKTAACWSPKHRITCFILLHRDCSQRWEDF